MTQQVSQQVDRRVLTEGIMAIPPGKRAPYGNDVAATGTVGGARSSVRGRAGHLAQRPSGHRAERVSGREEACTSRSTATARAGAGDRAASESRTRAETQVRPLGNAVQHLRNLVFLSKPTEPPLTSRVTGYRIVVFVRPLSRSACIGLPMGRVGHFDPLGPSNNPSNTPTFCCSSFIFGASLGGEY